MTRLFFLVIVFLECSCSLRKDSNKFYDPVLIKISDFQDRRQSDSLYQFLTSNNPVFRKEAALAFASVQDTLAAVVLGNILLEDPDPGVRKAAAFALGQTGGFLAVNSLIPATSDKDLSVAGEALEALGKTVTQKDIGVLIAFKANDTLTQAGLAWGFYHLGVRRLGDSAVIDRCRDFLNPANAVQTRLGAAHFFNRSPVLPNQNYAVELLLAAKEDLNVFVRMAATSGLRKINLKESLEALKEIISNDNDYRVKINAARALSNFPFDETQDVLFTALNDENANVGIAASEVIKGKTTIDYQGRIIEKARAIRNWRIQADLYEVALALASTGELIKEVEAVYSSSTNDYQKSWLLASLSKTVETFPFIKDELFTSNVLVIKSSAAQALVTINHSKDFSVSLKEEFSLIYKNAIEGGDLGVIVSITSALRDSTLDYRSSITDFDFLYVAKNKLALPKDIEALQPLEEAIAYFEKNKKPGTLKNEFNHPINWELTKSITADQQVLIKTTKGDIIMQLFVEESPGSVTNFVELCNQKYFDGKYFHRVVPNFVVQAGCNRGDGFGSEAYSIRSEFSGRRYTEGSMGMASAGKDTEGTQWFITHSPTPHLDGKYTVFAEVVSGMEVVHQLEVGDQIVSAHHNFSH